MSKVIVHIDLNAFFVRAEEIRNPDLIDKPVAIGHEGRSGIVSTCSYEARKYGVRSGMPMFQATRLCPKLIILPVDFRYYRALSDTFYAFLRNYTDKIEIASVDECFLDFTDVFKDKSIKADSYFKSLQNELYKKTQLKCSIGVSTTKFLAKMGSDYKKPMGITIIRKKDIKDIIYPLPIDSMFGIGKKTAPELKRIGINTIGDLKDAIDDESNYEIRRLMGKFFYTANEWLEGKGDDVVQTEREELKSIGNSTTLPENQRGLENVRYFIRKLCEKVSYRAKKDNMLGTTIQLSIKTTTFSSKSKSITLKQPINDVETLVSQSEMLYKDNFDSEEIRLVGVTLTNLVHPENVVMQMDLFNDSETTSVEETKDLIEKINKKMNKKVLKKASEV